MSKFRAYLPTILAISGFILLLVFIFKNFQESHRNPHQADSFKKLVPGFIDSLATPSGPDYQMVGDLPGTWICPADSHTQITFFKGDSHSDHGTITKPITIHFPSSGALKCIFGEETGTFRYWFTGSNGEVRVHLFNQEDGQQTSNRTDDQLWRLSFSGPDLMSIKRISRDISSAEGYAHFELRNEDAVNLVRLGH